MKSAGAARNLDESAAKTPGSLRRRRLWGLVVWKEHWTLSRRAILLAIGATAALGAVLISQAYAFLAIRQPQGKGILIVEGWIPPYSVHHVAKVFALGDYRQVVIVRALYEGEPGVLHGQNAGEYIRTVLARNGVPDEKLQLILFPGHQRDRTYHSALAVKRWFSERGESPDNLDIATLGPHARRSRLLYQRAFGAGIQIGVCALDNPHYDGSRWWRSSEGTREVLSESLAYLYCRVVSKSD